MLWSHKNTTYAWLVINLRLGSVTVTSQLAFLRESEPNVNFFSPLGQQSLKEEKKPQKSHIVVKESVFQALDGSVDHVDHAALRCVERQFVQAFGQGEVITNNTKKKGCWGPPQAVKGR